MILSIDDREDILVKNENRELMLKLRHEVSKTFSHVWIFLYNDNNQQWGLEVTNTWGSKLPQDIRAKVEEFVEKFMLEYKEE